MSGLLMMLMAAGLLGTLLLVALPSPVRRRHGFGGSGSRRCASGTAGLPRSPPRSSSKRIFANAAEHPRARDSPSGSFRSRRCFAGGWSRPAELDARPICDGLRRPVWPSSLLLFKGVPLSWRFLGLLVGLGLPHFVISKLIQRRVDKFTSRFPDAIELMVRGLRSGLPISETIGIVANEIQEPVGIEFRAVADKMKIGRTMEAALQETADRLDTAEFQFFVISLAIQRETGGNLAETLSNLAEVLRKRAQMKLKIRAMSSESKASAYIIGALPFIVFGLIWFINGKYMQNFFVDARLMIAGGVGLVWMASAPSSCPR